MTASAGFFRPVGLLAMCSSASASVMFYKIVCVCVCVFANRYLCLVPATFSVTASTADEIIISFNLTVSEGLSDISQD